MGSLLTRTIEPGPPGVKTRILVLPYERRVGYSQVPRLVSLLLPDSIHTQGKTWTLTEFVWPSVTMSEEILQITAANEGAIRAASEAQEEGLQLLVQMVRDMQADYDKSRAPAEEEPARAPGGFDEKTGELTGLGPPRRKPKEKPPTSQEVARAVSTAQRMLRDAAKLQIEMLRAENERKRLEEELKKANSGQNQNVLALFLQTIQAVHELPQDKLAQIGERLNGNGAVGGAAGALSGPSGEGSDLRVPATTPAG